MKKILKAAAALMLLMTMAVLTACTSDNDDNPASGTDREKWISGSGTFTWGLG